MPDIQCNISFSWTYFFYRNKDFTLNLESEAVFELGTSFTSVWCTPHSSIPHPSIICPPCPDVWRPPRWAAGRWGHPGGQRVQPYCRSWRSAGSRRSERTARSAPHYCAPAVAQRWHYSYSVQTVHGSILTPHQTSLKGFKMVIFNLAIFSR